MTEEMKLEIARLTLDYLVKLQNDGAKGALRKIEVGADIKKDEATFADLYNAVFQVIAKSITPGTNHTKPQSAKVTKPIAKTDTDAEQAKASH